jgi:protein ImuB
MGDFAALPPPSVGRRWAAGGVDAQALAQGQDRTPLCAFVPVEPIAEEQELEAEVTELEPLAFVLRPLFERARAGLGGRGRAAARTAVRLRGRDLTTEVVVAPSVPTTSSRTLIDLARAHLAEKRLEHAVTKVVVVVLEEGEAQPQELELWRKEDETPDAAAVDVAVARLRAAFGPDAAYGTELRDEHRPEASYAKVPFALKRGPRASGLRPRAADPDPEARGLRPEALGPLRLLQPPPKIEAEEDPQHAPRAIRVGGAQHRVVQAQGPLRLEGEWWTDEPLGRDYFEVETDDGAHYWLFRDHADGGFYLHGVFD